MTYIQERAALTYFYGKRKVHYDARSQCHCALSPTVSARRLWKCKRKRQPDDRSFTHMDPRWKHPFTCIVAGPTGCGKTTFVTRGYISYRSSASTREIATKFFHNDRSLTRTRYVVLRGMAVSVRESRHTKKNLRLEEGLPTSFDASKRTIVVLDDLMAETDERVTNLFTKKNHHCNTSVIYLVQNLFQKTRRVAPSV